jgi:hypothetical protein
MLLRRIRCRPASAEFGARLPEEAAFMMLAFLADIERGYGPVVTHHPGPYLARLPLVVGQSDGAFEYTMLNIHLFIAPLHFRH